MAVLEECGGDSRTMQSQHVHCFCFERGEGHFVVWGASRIRTTT